MKLWDSSHCPIWQNLRSIENMSLRFARAVLVGLLLLQSGLLAPAAMALDTGQAMADCADHMGTSDNDCPCCPQSVSTSAGCASICLGVLAGMSHPPELLTDAIEHPNPSFPASFLASQTYAPVNPPPIV